MPKKKNHYIVTTEITYDSGKIQSVTMRFYKTHDKLQTAWHAKNYFLNKFKNKKFDGFGVALRIKIIDVRFISSTVEIKKVAQNYKMAL